MSSNINLIEKVKIQIKQKGYLTSQDLMQLNEIDSRIMTRLVAYSNMDCQTITSKIKAGDFSSNLILPVLDDLVKEISYI